MGRRVTRSSSRKEDRGLPEELEDEVEKFHKQRDYIPLDPDVEEESSEDGEEVMGLESEETDSEEEQDSEGISERDTEEEEFDEKESKSLQKLIRAEKAMREKVMKEQAGISEDEEEEEEEEDQSKGWGKRKIMYYGADNQDVELTDDEEAPREEEEEAMRIQRERSAMLRPEDFEEEEEEEEEGTTLGGKADAASRGRRMHHHVQSQVETVPKDKGGLTDQEKLSLVVNDAPELVGLLSDLKKGLDQIRERIHPVIEKVKVGALATREGMSYLEAKNLLMLSYCTNIVFYLLLKAEGKPVRDHPVMQRLVQIRAYLEKIRPIDKKMQYQIDKLLKLPMEGDAVVSTDQNGTNDPLKHRPNPEALMSKEDEGLDDMTYRPPKITPVSFADDKDKESRKERRKNRETKVQASRSSLIRELAAELEGRPEEHREELAQLEETVDGRRQRRFLEERSKAEEDLFVRVPLNKEERKRLRAQKRSGMSTRFEDFREEVASILEDAIPTDREVYTNEEDTYKRKRLQETLREADPFSSTKKKRFASGDADLPTRPSLAQRRMEHESRIQALRRRDKEGTFSDQEEGEGVPPSRIEDETYLSAKELLQAKRKLRSERYDPSKETRIPLEDETIHGSRRNTTMEIDRNRGLTPHRRRDRKNPRKKHRMQHEKALVRRRGQVRDVRTTRDAYGGESTGVRKNVTKSVKL